MAQLTLGQVVRLTGVAKTTLSRAIKSGRLSASRRDDGAYLVDPAELERVYAMRADASGATDSVAHHAAPACDPETAARIAELEAEVRGLQALLAEVKSSRDAALAEIRAGRDTAQEQLRQVLAALPPPRRPWWRRWQG